MALKSHFRLIPTLLVVACTALGFRLAGVAQSDLVRSLSLSGSAVAQEAPAAENGAEREAEPGGDKEAGQSAEDGKPGAETAGDRAALDQPPPDAPIAIGLPTESELAVITQLRERRQQLERREAQIELQSQLLASTEQRISTKIAELEALEERVRGHLRLFEEREAEQLASIVQVYEKMKAKEAAPRFEALALPTQLDLVTRMKSSKVAALMAAMTTQGASRLTTELATLAQPPTLEDIRGAGGES